jgi:hypothetical protein
MKETGDTHIVVSGRVAGIVLDDYRQLKQIYIHGLDNSLWISDGWKFIEDEEEEEDAEI